MVNFAKWFDLGVAVFQDRDYSLGEGAVTKTSRNLPAPGSIIFGGGTGLKATGGQLRASIKFA